MANIIEITSTSHPGVEVFSTMTEAQLRQQIEQECGLFIAESPKVIHVALQAGYTPTALLCERKHIEGDAKDGTVMAGQIAGLVGKQQTCREIIEELMKETQVVVKKENELWAK